MSKSQEDIELEYKKTKVTVIIVAVVAAILIHFLCPDC